MVIYLFDEQILSSKGLSSAITVTPSPKQISISIEPTYTYMKIRPVDIIKWMISDIGKSTHRIPINLFVWNGQRESNSRCKAETLVS